MSSDDYQAAEQAHTEIIEELERRRDQAARYRAKAAELQGELTFRKRTRTALLLNPDGIEDQIQSNGDKISFIELAIALNEEIQKALRETQLPLYHKVESSAEAVSSAWREDWRRVENDILSSQLLADAIDLIGGMIIAHNLSGGPHYKSVLEWINGPLGQPLMLQPLPEAPDIEGLPATTPHAKRLNYHEVQALKESQALKYGPEYVKAQRESKNAKFEKAESDREYEKVWGEPPTLPDQDEIDAKHERRQQAIVQEQYDMESAYARKKLWGQ